VGSFECIAPFGRLATTVNRFACNSKVANLFSPVLFIHHITKQNCNLKITTAALPPKGDFQGG